MKKLIIILLLFIPELLMLSRTEIIQRDKYYNQFKYLNERLYSLYSYRSKQFDVPLKLALCIVKTESNGKNVISKKNKNGTFDSGRFQINSIHSKKPKKLLNDNVNSWYGFCYLSMCLEKTDMPDAIRLYNQGIYGKRKYYKNWKYVEKVLKCYSRDITSVKL